MQVEHVQPGYPVLVDIPAHAFHFLVASRAEGFVARSRENHHADVIAFAADIHGIQHLEIRLRSESVIHLLAVDRDLGNSLEEIEFDIFVLLDCCPVSF